MSRRIKAPSPALVVALIALFVSIGGVGYAASQIGTNDIKNGAVTAKKLHKKAVRSKKIKKEAVKTGKIRDLAVTTDKLGDQAVTTDKLGNESVNADKLGADSVTTGKVVDGAIAATKLGTIVKRVGSVTVANNTTGTANATCLPGERLISGGGGFLGGETDAEVSFSGQVGDPGNWRVHARNMSGAPKTLEAQVHCLQ